MTSTTIHLLTILSVLIAPLSALSPIIRHSGKSHPHPKIRQRPEGNGPVGGLNELVTLPTVPNSSPSSIHIILRDTMLPTPTGIDIMSTATNPPTISFYVFPTTVIQIAVATNCPDTSSSSPIFSILPTDPASYHATNTTKSTSRIATDYLPVYVNATVLLPNGSSTVFLSLSTSTITATTTIPAMSLKPTETPLAETARIILDGNGCQTVYTAMTVPICSTTIRLPGMLPVPVTDCDQWVTFSSQKLGDCSSTDDTILASASPSPLRITGPVAFYAAHWYELVQGPVPNIVQVENCLPRATSSLICQTSSEAWSVVYNTEVITTSSVASFSGPVILTSSTSTFTTFLSFFTTATTYATVTSSSIARTRIPDNIPSSTSQETVMVVVSTPTTRTWLLEEVTKSTATATVTVSETSTVEVTETKTRTISTDTRATAVEDVGQQSQ